MSNKSGLRKNLLSLVSWISVYILVHSVIFVTIPSSLPEVGKAIEGYYTYIAVGMTLLIGYMIVKSLSEFAYWSARVRYDEGTSAAIRSLVRIVGIASLISGIAGGVAGGAAGVALGGFLGIVVGQAGQQVIGQGVAGFIILISRPISIGDRVTVAGETGIIKDVTTMFTVIEREDSSIAMIPNNMLMGSKIYKHTAKKDQSND
ncbi:MAG: mechanosensitive ion channel family protein [Candidatus Korarchaeum sp.]|nr:mechanosensitive ion channel family protein [Candidatus Korarchaeum sp.]MDW8035870.1 mechanosensitive ion channel [Candidatus Korarchaeum sp.]